MGVFVGMVTGLLMMFNLVGKGSGKDGCFGLALAGAGNHQAGQKK